MVYIVHIINFGYPETNIPGMVDVITSFYSSTNIIDNCIWSYSLFLLQY